MKRPLHILSAISLILALLSAGVWIRSHCCPERFEWRHWKETQLETSWRCTCHALDIQLGKGNIAVRGRYQATTDPMSWTAPAFEYTHFYLNDGPAPNIRLAYLRDDFVSGDRDGILRGFALTLPLPLCFLLFALLPTRWIFVRRKNRRLHALRENRCTHCGYDLRATPDRCPECGKETAASSDAAR